MLRNLDVAREASRSRDNQPGRHSNHYCYNSLVKAQAATKLEFVSQEAVERFRKAAKDFTARSTKSQAAARKVLVEEGIYTKSGKLTKQYR